MSLIKVGYTDNSFIKKISENEFSTQYASPEILNRLEKFAGTIQAVAPKSNDFLYFTIIFLKSAEAALIDDAGNLKKIGSEKAWGYFDENWKWHGNVKPHKNNNGDIFPESELKKAARSWIGRPLCVDHKSDSVDGVRGIILDTYYDEKLKQVVGLCALDKVNYPDLSRKVETGIVRYGSMGTAVSMSICSDCGQKALTAKDYCNHILKREAWGEINIGLNPIEYSLVVQPAEPGAILLRCIASIKNHKNELNNYGLDVDNLVKNIDEKTANDLDLLLNSVCGSDGCSLEQRQRIIKGYLSTNGFTKQASNKKAQYDKELLSDLARFEDVFGVKITENPELYRKFFGDSLNIAEGLIPASVEKLTSEQLSSGADTIMTKDDQGVSDFTGTGSSGLISGVSEPNPDSFNTDGVGPEHYAFSAEDKNKNISKIAEEIMNESRLRRRAAARRRLAYHQGGSAPDVEPKTFKDEGEAQNKIREDDDKHMNLKPTNLGGTDGMVPGDKETKEKLLRANDKGTRKIAYHPADSKTPVEPSTFKSEDYKKYWDSDKHMHQTKSMGGDKGMFPGDESIKENLKRAKYNGPSLSTKFKQKRFVDGSINKSASCFEVYSGDKLVIAATAGEIFGSKLNENWDWITSKDYAKTVIAEIRNNGLNYVGSLLTKSAQELPTELPEETPLVGDMPAEPLPEEVPAPEMEMVDDSPKAVVEDALVSMEDTIEKIRGAITDLGGEDVDVNINVGEKPEMPEDKIALSKQIFEQLKVVLGEATDSADELAMLSETYEKFAKLTNSQKKDLNNLSMDALNDHANIVGQSKTLVSMAKTISQSLVKTSEYVEEKLERKAKVRPTLTSKKVEAKQVDDLVSKAMELRKQRRQDLLKKAEKEEMESCADDVEKDGEKDVKENDAHDGIGMKENAKVSGVTKDTAESVATKQPIGGEHKPAPSAGNKDAQQFDSYPTTPAKTVAEKGVQVNHASDMGDAAELHEMIEDEVKEEVEKEKLSDVKSKLNETFTKKKAEEEREAYRIKLRRAYDVAMEMQRKGMIASTRSELDRQVDNIMEFDDKSFEAFKRSIANFQGNQSSKISTASDYTLNSGLTDEPNQTTKINSKITPEQLAALFNK